jgi:hypothetical protein
MKSKDKTLKQHLQEVKLWNYSKDEYAILWADDYDKIINVVKEWLKEQDPEATAWMLRNKIITEE